MPGPNVIEKTFPLDLAPGDPSEQFFRHFNSLISAPQRRGQGTVRFSRDGSSEAITTGHFSIANRDRAIEVSVATVATGAIASVTVRCAPADQQTVEQFLEESIRIALVNALSDKRQEFFTRRLLSYLGAVVPGEYWLRGLRFAPAFVEPDPTTHYRMDFERIVVLDFVTKAIDQHQSFTLGNVLETAYTDLLSLLLETKLDRMPLSWVWVDLSPEGRMDSGSERRSRRFLHRSARVMTMPKKGALMSAAPFDGSTADYFRHNAARPLTLPRESRALFRLLQKAPLPEALALGACAKMCRLSLALRPYSQSAALAYRVAAIDAIVTALRPRFESVSDFVRHYAATFSPTDELLDFLHGTVRSGHFHAGSVPLDRESFVPFHALMEPFGGAATQLGFSSELIVHTAIGEWLKDIASQQKGLGNDDG